MLAQRSKDIMTVWRIDWGSGMLSASAPLWSLGDPLVGISSKHVVRNKSIRLELKLTGDGVETPRKHTGKQLTLFIQIQVKHQHIASIRAALECGVRSGSRESGAGPVGFPTPSAAANHTPR
eukprot:2174203-Rhodomonas_salina.1